MAIVLPESVFDTTENKYIRLFLFWYFDVVAVVSLPQLAFQPYTQTKTSILFAKKKRAADVRAWAEAWSQARSLWGQIRTRVQNYVDVHVRGTQVRQDRLGSGQFLGVEPSPINGLGWLEPGVLVVTRMLPY